MVQKNINNRLNVDSEIKEKIIAVFQRVFETVEIEETVSQQNFPKWDSLNHLNLVVELEDEFDVSFEPEEIVELKNLQIIKDVIINKLQ
ncbi:MAG: acyl carrier protein [Prevotellaceae bacterium]|jgi:acyl carrier protein|nr:acyl carrier protein [Prevotellaceae bacterium]